MKKVIIAGGAGFIGTHLCEAYLEKGWFVLCVDNFTTSTRLNVEHLLNHPNFKLLEHDITIPFDSHKVSLILNFACPASPIHYQDDPVRTIKTNVIGTLNLLNLAKRNGARFLQASTSEVYGDPKEHPQREDYWGNVNPIGIRSCYDEGKRIAETLCFDYRRKHGVDIRVVRIFNTYGPRMAADDGRVVSNFIVQALQGAALTVYGEGQQTRSFCFVDDLVDGIIRFSEKENVTGPINLGNDHEFTILELANEVLRQTSSASKIVYKPLPLDDPKTRKPDLTKAKEILNGWYPKISLAEGIEKTISWFKKPPKQINATQSNNFPNFFIAPPTVAPNDSIDISFSKNDLAKLKKLSCSDYYRDQHNWKFICLYYKGTNGQKRVISQKANSNFNKLFKVSANSGVVFKLEKIVIKGKNNTIITIKRGDLDNPCSADITIL